ncbi:tRNA-specific adenosine deaminase [Rubrobacter aplysinae]|uniref:hypothetical protein n=1 Tax=Rubrobacter aplysinae TaxID=909625 RepID=UPI00064C14F9|nr:hypothetical protein [Rubrobacter aplysinae]
MTDPTGRATELEQRNVERGGRPFSCVVASSSDGAVLAESPSLLAQTNDPTVHAEVVAIREACQRLGSPRLEGYEISRSRSPGRSSPPSRGG